MIAVFTALVSCGTVPQNPYTNPDNAKIIPDNTLSNMHDSLAMGAAYSCTVNVLLPGLIDSVIVRVGRNGFDSVFFRDTIKGRASAVFPFSWNDTGAFTMQIVIVKKNGARDSLAPPKGFIVYTHPVPRVTPAQTAYHAYLGDSITVKFHVIAKDSNLLGYSTSLSLDADSAKARRVDVYYPLTSRIGDDTLSRTLRKLVLREGLVQPIVCYAQAVDRRYNYSAMAACTVYVSDTTRPSITLVHPQSGDSIVSLPDSVVVRAGDNWAIDSVTFNGGKMSLVNDTSVTTMAKGFFSTLVKGVTFDTIVAWDKARNSDTLILMLKYGGPATYPPTIKNLNRSVREGRSFDTLFLDTFVTITDPAILDAATYRASCNWIITDSAGNGVSSYNALTRKLTVPVNSDSEWTDTFNLNFKVIAPGGLWDSRVGMFMINEIPDPPKITLDTLQIKFAGVPFDTLLLDTCAKDPDNAPTTLNWKFKNGNYFKVDSIMSSFRPIGHSGLLIRHIFFTRRIVVVPDTTKIKAATLFGSDTLTFTVTDPTQLFQTKRIVFRKMKFIMHSSTDQATVGAGKRRE